MTVPCSIFRRHPVYWCVVVPIVFFSATAVVHAELVFGPNSALISAMGLGSMALVFGIRDWGLFYIWMAGWMFAGAWLLLQVAH